MVNLHLLTKDKKEIAVENVSSVEWQEENLAVRYLNDGVITLWLFDYKDLDNFKFKEVGKND